MRWLRAGVLLVLALGFLSCGMFKTKIGDIREDPRKYDGTLVTVAGTVKEATNLGFVKFYVLDDGTGEIHVVTDHPLPRKGNEVRARGTVKEEFSIGSSSLVVIKER
jgi:hypothetical protein